MTEKDSRGQPGQTAILAVENGAKLADWPRPTIRHIIAARFLWDRLRIACRTSGSLWWVWPAYWLWGLEVDEGYSNIGTLKPLKERINRRKLTKWLVFVSHYGALRRGRHRS